MFRKNKVFLFQQPLENAITRRIDQNFNHRTQVIIYGSLANDVMKDVIKKKKDLLINEDRDIYAFQKIVDGSINATLTVSCKSEIKYQETRKKQHKTTIKTVDCKHDDEFNQNNSMITGNTSQFLNCEPKFDSEMKTLIYIVGKDEEENNSILQKLKDIPNMDNNTITMCHLYKNGEASFSSNNTKIQVNHYTTYSIHTVAKDILERIEKCTDFYIENLINEKTNNIKTEILQGFQNTLDEKADVFFDTKSSFSCFR
jgi:hypothetical protein